MPKTRITQSKSSTTKIQNPGPRNYHGCYATQISREKFSRVVHLRKIGDVFSNLSTAQTAYAEAVRGLAELSTLLTPQQYTLLLTATATPAIQLVVPGQMISPLSKPPPPQPESSTSARRLEIMRFTKMQVLLDPDSDALGKCDDNSATRVLAAVVYSQLERHYFDETRLRMDVAMLFHYNSSQLAKAITGVDYKSGPHRYKPKKRKGKADSSKTDPTKAKTCRKEDIVESDQKESALPEEDTLSSSSGSSVLPAGLL